MKKVKGADANIKVYFCNPVPVLTGRNSWNAELVSSYNSLIFHKSDLGTIEARLKEGGFPSPAHWENAVRTAFRNSFVFNKPGLDAISDAVLAAAEAGSKVFELEICRLKGIPVVPSPAW